MKVALAFQRHHLGPAGGGKGRIGIAEIERRTKRCKFRIFFVLRLPNNLSQGQRGTSLRQACTARAAISRPPRKLHTISCGITCSRG
jgi:hypothetical protein